MADDSRLGDALKDMKTVGVEKPRTRDKVKKWWNKSVHGDKPKGTKSVGKHGKVTPPPSGGRGYPVFSESDITGRIANFQAYSPSYSTGTDGAAYYTFSLHASAPRRDANAGNAVLKVGGNGIEELVVNLGGDLRPASTVRYGITPWLGRGDRVPEVDLEVRKDTTLDATGQTYDWLALRVLGAMETIAHHNQNDVLASQISTVKDVLRHQYLRHYGKPNVAKAAGG